MPPFFSVILPTYNRGYCLARAIASVRRQTFPAWELIVADDGSTDDSPAVVERLAAQEPRIRYIHQPNRGQAAARNVGIQLARGRYAAFIDSDDRFSGEHLELRRRLLVADPTIDFLYGGLNIEGPPFVPDRNDPRTMLHMEEHGLTVTGTFVIRLTALKALGGFPDRRYSEDGVLLDNAFAAGLNVQECRFRTYHYNRNSPDSICTQVQRAAQPQV